jgi:hypothetical protein
LKQRSCPLCGHHEASTILVLEAGDFCRWNPTYRATFRELLGLPRIAEFPIVRCNQCGFVFARFLPDERFLQLVYESVVDPAACEAQTETISSYVSRLRYVSTLLELQESRDREFRALDFGSGLGLTVKIFSACGIEAIGYEPSESRLRSALANGARVTGSLDEIRAEGPFSIIVIDNVLEHLPDPLQTLEQLSLMTTTDAVIYVSVPSYEESFLQEQVGKHRLNTSLDITLNPWEHLNYFSLKTLDRLLDAVGFQRIKVAELRTAPDIGLRAEPHLINRFVNAGFSGLRLLRYALSGDGVTSVQRAYYRRASH